MPHLIWSTAATFDVQRLYRFLAKKNRSAASRAVGAIRSGVKILAVHPHAGRVVDATDVSLREWPVVFGESGYFVLYRVDGLAILILHVRAGKENTYRDETT